MSIIERRIGIDFGTSTTVMCYLDFGENQTAGQLKFVNLDPDGERDRRLMETVIYDAPDGERRFGRLARTMHRRDVANGGPVGTLARNFKMDLLSAEKRGEAKERMGQIFREVNRLYLHHKSFDPVPHGTTLVERTFVSFPALWSPPLREATIAAAKEAGFGDDVAGMDEPSAAMKFFLYYEIDRFNDLQRRGVIGASKPIVVLLIDMGAGTSDFVLFKTMLGSAQADILSTWPAARGALSSDDTLGGKDIDDVLSRFVDDYVQRNRAPDRPYRPFAPDIIVQHKETQVSPKLAQNAVIGIDDFYELENMARYVFRPDATPYRIDRKIFGREVGGHIEKFLRLLEGALVDATDAQAIDSVRDIDLVLLTGGHSQWYFFSQLLSGDQLAGFQPDRDGGAALDRIARLKSTEELDRLLVQTDPQTIVARGLVVPVDIEPIAANNLWYEIDLDLTPWAAPPAAAVKKAARIVAVSRGEKLPIKTARFYRLEIEPPTPARLHVVARIVPVVGPTFGGGERFPDGYAMSAELKAAWPKRRERIIVDIYIEVDVTKAEEVSFVGYLGFDPTDGDSDAVFWSRNVSPLDERRQDELGGKWLDARERPGRITKLELMPQRASEDSNESELS